MKSCNNCVHHRVCLMHKAMADKIRIREYPMTIDLVLFCIDNSEWVRRALGSPGNYMHEIAEASLACTCSDFKARKVL